MPLTGSSALDARASASRRSSLHLHPRLPEAVRFQRYPALLRAAPEGCEVFNFVNRELANLSKARVLARAFLLGCLISAW